MKAGHALLASALSLILILQSSTSVDASAAAGEWTVLEGEVYVWKTDRPDETVRVVAGQQLATHPEEFLPGPTSADSFIKSVETLKARDPTLVFPAGNTLSDDEFIFYGAIAIIIFFVIIAAVVIGIYFGAKKIRNRKKQKLV